MRRAALTQLSIVQLLALLGTATCLAQSPSAAEGHRAEIARAIRNTVEDLQTLRQTQRREEKGHQAQVERIQRQIELLRQELQPIEEAVESEQQEIAHLEGEIAKREKLAANARAWIGAAADKAKPVATAISRRVAQGVGEQKLRRLTEFTKTAELLSSQEPLQRVEGIREFLRVLGDEWLPARSVTLSNETVLTDGGTKLEHAWVVGFGLVAKAFVSEDGQRSGISSTDPESDWKLDLPGDSQQQVRELIEVVREQRPPAVTPLPVMTSPSTN